MTFVDNDGVEVTPPDINFEDHVPLERRQYMKFLEDAKAVRLRIERITTPFEGEWSVVQGMKNFLRAACADLFDYLEPAARLYEMTDRSGFPITEIVMDDGNEAG